jgi:hypothetical protein
MASRASRFLPALSFVATLGLGTSNARAQSPPAKSPTSPAAHESEGARLDHEGGERHDARPDHEGGEHHGAQLGHEGGERHGEGEAKEHEARLELGIDTVIGFGRRTASGEGESERVTAASSVIEGSFRVVGGFHVGALVPFSHEVIAPAGEHSFAENALGNLALTLAYEHELSRALVGRVGLTLAAPTASGDRFAASEGRERVGEANEWAALTRGYAEDELFAPHHAGAGPSLGLDYHHGVVELGGSVKVPLLVREGGADPARESGLSESALAVEVIPAAYGFYDLPTAHLALGASAYAVYFAVDEIRSSRASARHDPKVQPVVEPEARLTLHPFRLALGYILPVGGRLGVGTREHEHAGGVRLAIGAEI